MFDAERERERRLAAQARAGAEWALTALIARYQPTVVRYLTRLCGSPEQARTLAERIFQRMERRLHGPRGAENLRLWLLRASTEAGLDALRRPQRASAVRLGAGRVAGLLTRQSGQGASSGEQSGRLHLRTAHGSASQQARPLVWAEDAATTAHANDATSAPTYTSGASADGHIDEELDRLDPRDALRHRLVRVTLAELPYGDAQCLALHLVAGLNQAEVARALGLTNSAARKRIVHGLAQFAERYTQAVQSLGLPDELGFGDALPRPAVDLEPVAEPARAPVIVSSQPPSAPMADAAEDAETRAPGKDSIVEDPARAAAAYEAAGLASVAYLRDESSETSSETPILPPPYPLSKGLYADAQDGYGGYSAYETVAPYDDDERFAGYEGYQASDGFDSGASAASRPAAVSDAGDAPGRQDEGASAFALTGEAAQQEWQPVTVPVTIAVEDPPMAPVADVDAEPKAPPLDIPEHLDQQDAFGPGPVSGGMVTRLAADAIIGPIVDALPVSPAPALPETMGLIGPRSAPLAYELNSSNASGSGADPSSVMMNWLDESGLMTPLTFEAIAVPTDTLTPAEPFVEGAALGLEAVAVPTGALTPLGPLTPPADEGEALSFESVALPASAPDYDAAHETGAALEYELAPATAIEHVVETLAAPSATPFVVYDDAADALTPVADSLPAAAPLAAPDARPAALNPRSLEDLWDELPD